MCCPRGELLLTAYTVEENHEVALCLLTRVVLVAVCAERARAGRAQELPGRGEGRGDHPCAGHRAPQIGAPQEIHALRRQDLCTLGGPQNRYCAGSVCVCVCVLDRASWKKRRNGSRESCRLVRVPV